MKHCKLCGAKLRSTNKTPYCSICLTKVGKGKVMGANLIHVPAFTREPGIVKRLEAQKVKTLKQLTRRSMDQIRDMGFSGAVTDRIVFALTQCGLSLAAGG